MIRLRPVDKYNFVRVLKLELAKEQEDFVTSNAFSLSQAYVMPECRPFALYSGMDPVGFVMYTLDEDDREYWIYRLMIDRREQRKGYGREGLRETLKQIRREAPDRKVVYISVDPANTVARRLYESEGFVPDGRVVDGEDVLMYTYAD